MDREKLKEIENALRNESCEYSVFAHTGNFSEQDRIASIEELEHILKLIKDVKI